MLDILTPARTGAEAGTGPGASQAAEQAFQDVGEVGSRAEVEVDAPGAAGPEAGWVEARTHPLHLLPIRAELIILPPLLRIRQHLVGRLNFLEAGQLSYRQDSGLDDT